MTCGRLTKLDPEICCQSGLPPLPSCAPWPSGPRIYLLLRPRPGYGRVSDDGVTSGCLDPVKSTQAHCTQSRKKWGGLLGEGCLVIHRAAFSGGGNCECRTVAGGGVFGGSVKKI